MNWILSKERKATASDGDCEGSVWVFREMFGEDPETCEMKSAGWSVHRANWRDVARNPEGHPFWMPTGLVRPTAPEQKPEYKPHQF